MQVLVIEASAQLASPITLSPALGSSISVHTADGMLLYKVFLLLGEYRTINNIGMASCGSLKIGG